MLRVNPCTHTGWDAAAPRQAVLPQGRGPRQCMPHCAMLCAMRLALIPAALSFALSCGLTAQPFAAAPPATPVAAPPTVPAATSVATGDLRVFFIDVEGGQATLFVAPSGESLLIDAGWPGHDGRDADRIVAAAHQAGLQRIDDVLITHFHDDHVGGVPQLLQRMPVGTFLTHGKLYEQNETNRANVSAFVKATSRDDVHVLVLHVGDPFPMRGLDATVISSDGQVIGQPVPGAGRANPECATDAQPAEDLTENGHSLGILIRFAGVRILDLGDLTKDRERMLVCPANRIGPIDIDIVSHHGWEQSSSPSFVHAIHPRIAIMDNGATKGGSTPVLDVFRGSPGLETLWQLHTSEEGAAKPGSLEHNTAPEYIANTPGVEGKMLVLTIHPDGSYEVRNERTGQGKSYTATR